MTKQCTHTEARPFDGRLPLLDQWVIDDLERLSGADEPDLLSILVAEFMQVMPTQIDLCHQHILQHRWHDLADSCAAMKSSAANLGAMQLAEACHRLEAASQQALSSQAGEYLAIIKNQYREVLQLLRDYHKIL